MVLRSTRSIVMQKKIGQMSKCKLSDITIQIYDGKHGGCSKELGSGLYFISVKDIDGLELNYESAMEIPQNEFNQIFSRTNLEEGDTLYANTGDTIGKSVYVTENPLVNQTTFQKSVAVVKPDKAKVFPPYLYYLLKYETPRLRAAASGSGQKNLLLETMRNFETEVHDMPEQIKIANVLKSIDDKIKKNNAKSRELEKMVKLIYDYWFVQFDFPDENGKPYKSNGGKIVRNEELKREIPDGWQVVNLMENQLCEVVKAGVDVFEKKSYLPTGNINGEDITNGEYKLFESSSYDNTSEKLDLKLMNSDIDIYEHTKNLIRKILKRNSYISDESIEIYLDLIFHKINGTPIKTKEYKERYGKSKNAVYKNFNSCVRTILSSVSPEAEELRERLNSNTKPTKKKG